MSNFKIATFLALGLLVGCATADSQIIDVDGVREYRITCGDTPFSHFQDCRDRAAEICTNFGYTILKEDDVGRGRGGQGSWSMTTHELVMRCNLPETKGIM